MTNIKVKFRVSKMKDKEGTLFFQVIHARQSKHISTGYKLFINEWDTESASVVIPDREGIRKQYLTGVKKEIENEIMRFNLIIRMLEKNKSAYTLEDIIKAYTVHEKSMTLFFFMTDVIRNLKSIGKIRLSETYYTTLNSFFRFRDGIDVRLCEIDSDLIVAYETYLKNAGVCPNSSSFYMRNLRAVYNRAVEKGIISQQYPFKHVYTGIDKTIKRAISLNELRQLKELDFSQNPVCEYARNLFLFSFYTRGMSFVDLAFLKKTDLICGILFYRRRKTGQLLQIRWEDCMQKIVDRFDTTDSPYLLPIIKTPGVNERNQYISAAHLVNRKLKEIGYQLRLPIPLTMYCARHAWASIAKSKNIPISVISEGMGHESEITTRIYLSSLDNSVIDMANKYILDLL